MYKSVMLGLISVCCFMASSNVNSAIITFTDKTAWEAAISGSTITLEQFNGGAQNFSDNSTGNIAGSITVDINGSGISNNITATGIFNMEPDSSPPDLSNIDFNFSSPIIGFGFTNLNGVRADGYGVRVQFDGFSSAEFGSIVGSNSAPFLGFVSNAPFSSINFFTTGFNDVWLFDDLVYASVSVPTPATLGLLGLGIAGLGWSRRKKA